MRLSDLGIRAAIQCGDLGIWPFIEKHVQPASYDLTFGQEWKVPTMTNEVAKSPADIRWTHYDLAEIVIPRESFMLAVTRERVKIGPGLCADLMGRSTLGRMGLAVHITAGLIDPGFEGFITLELHNVGPRPLLLRAGDPCGQLVFSVLDQDCNAPYNSKYQGASGVEAPKVF